MAVNLPKNTEMALVIIDPEQIKRAIKATDTLTVLWDLTQWLRNETKHESDETKFRHLDSVRTKLAELMDEYGVQFEELYT